MYRLLSLTVVFALAASDSAADLITINGLNREIRVEAELDFDNADDDQYEYSEDTAPDLGPWVSGVVANLFHVHGQCVSVADQNSAVVSSPLSGSVHLQGFSSAATIFGGIDAYDYVAPSGLSDSDAHLRFRVDQPVDYVLSGTIWSSVDPGDDWGSSIAWASVRAELGPEPAFSVSAEGDQTSFQETGTLYPGITYDIDVACNAEADADFDILTHTGRDYYGAAGYDVDLFLSPSTSPVVDQPAPGLNVTSHPNPFRGSTRVQLAASHDVLSTISIFDIRGRLVRRWIDVPATTALLEWDGRSSDGRPVSTGTYFLRAQSGREISQHKLVRVR